ncbi:MAG: sulfide:quinone oxidoreductase [Solirubrobacteraceae bacterium]|nr:sulfide:quinone oxidoreductase [Solirubrobacteraceae bacterium]
MPLLSQPLNVVIVGGGVAAAELALALDDLARERVKLTIVAPNPEFHLRPLSTAAPFSVDHVRHHSLSDLAKRTHATFIGGEVTAVDPHRHAVRLATGESVGYDALVLAVGARHRTAFTRAMTFTGDTSTVPFNGLLADLEEGWSHSVAFVVPPGTTWPLPLYELALMTARSVHGMGISDVRLQIISPEAAPLSLFGAQASDAVRELLDQAQIAFHGEACARSGERGQLELMPDGETIDAERVVALPTIEGPQLAGVPADDRGFIPIDENGRVAGVSDIYAAGDGTTYPVKQGGIACQLADAIAEQLAAIAGADVEPQPFAPVLRGRLLTGHGAWYLERPQHNGPADDPELGLRLWSASRKVDGRYLSPWLAELDGSGPEPVPADVTHVDIEVPLPAAYDALRFDPYSPLLHR